MSPAPRHLYLFLDEAGNLDFSRNGTRYFLLGCLTKERPFRAYSELAELKYDLIEQGIGLEYFHAAEDKQSTRNRVFDIIRRHLEGVRPSWKSDRPGYSCERTPWVLVTGAEPLNPVPACVLRRLPFDGMEPTFRHRRPKDNMLATGNTCNNEIYQLPDSRIPAKGLHPLPAPLSTLNSQPSTSAAPS